MINAVDTYKLDGVDIDWEYPRPESAGNFTALMRGLREALTSRFGVGSKLLTAAVVSDDQGQWYSQGVAPEVYQYLDFINIMAYDGPAIPHANYDWSIASFNFWVEKQGLRRGRHSLTARTLQRASQISSTSSA